MITYKKYIDETKLKDKEILSTHIRENKDIQDTTLYDIENNAKLYQSAMRAKNHKELKKAMLKMSSFPDTVNWGTVYTLLNERLNNSSI